MMQYVIKNHFLQSQRIIGDIMKPTLYVLAKELKQNIGAHIPMIGNYTNSELFKETRAKSDESISLAKYLICHLDNYRKAETFSKLLACLVI